jgi:glycerol uptake facilitator-like aquaporin
MLTGGSLNPARSLGPAIFANVWSHHYIYWIGPLIGGTIAGGFYRFIWSTNDHHKQ